MDALELAAMLLAVTVLLTYANLRIFRLPHPIGVMVLALTLSSGMILFDHLSLPVGHALKEVVVEIDFGQTVLRWMLGFFLFAGGLTIRIEDFLRQKWRVLGLAVLGTILFVVFAGLTLGQILPRCDLAVTLLGCMAFAVLISPTNPIAILDFLKSPRVPQRIKTAIADESLFSTAVVAVLFFIFIDAATGNRELSFGNAARAFLVEDGGAIVLGLFIGLVTLWLIRQVDQAEYTVLTSIAAVVGGYTLSDRLGICGPVVAACAGMCLGNAPPWLRITRESKEILARFWEPVEYGLETMLFVLLGLEMLVLRADERLSYVAVAVIVIWPIVLLARLLSVWVVSRIGRRRERMGLPELAAMTWGGPRGGVSLALAMVLPPGSERDCWIAVTYVVVMLSIVAQGLTLNRLIPLLECVEAVGPQPQRAAARPASSA
ncbi:MAG TPA: sodium:proton antiporter [Thermoguttaceae bacterium]|nr:sodium:proton antiporter [Thermoguttaceae bacterium]